jgi:alkylation response protein AidB-like acyl-CoA dehydrogenase
VDYVLAIEELSAVDGSVGITVAAHNSLGTNHIFLAGNEAQKRNTCRARRRRMAGGLGAHRARLRLGRQRARTTAVKKGDRYVLNGNKTSSPTAATPTLRWSSPSPIRARARMASRPSSWRRARPGFRPGKKENKLGLRASDTSELIFEDCEIPAENLLGVEGEGFVDAMRVLDGGRISIAALGAGHWPRRARCGLEVCEGAPPVRQGHRGVSGHSVEARRHGHGTDAARLLTQRAAVLKDAGRKVTRESAMAKLFASEVAVRICNEAVQLFGGYGFIKDYPAEKYYRDVKLCTIGEGTSEIQRMVIAREILKVHPSRG